VHRFAKGHRFRLVVATSNSTNRNSAVSGPVSITLDDKGTNVLSIPKLGAQSGVAGSGDSGTTPFGAAPGAPAPQVAQRPAFASGRGAAAKLPSSTSCKSRRKFTIHLRKPPRGDRIKSARVTINGKRQKVLRGKRVRAIVNLRGLPKGTFRVLITVKTKKGRTLRSARTYRTCRPGRS
jgi:hypothetical protein